MIDFLKNLIRYKFSSIRSIWNSKIYGMEVKAKSKIAAKFNEAIDKPVNKIRQKITDKSKKNKK